MIINWQNHTAAEHCLQGKVIAITGAGSGIGYTVAKHLAAYGATIILMGRTVEKLTTVYDDIEDNGYPQAAIIPVDFEHTCAADYQKICDSIEAEFGKLDGLIHNAAESGNCTSIRHYPLSIWEKVMQVNVNAPFALTQYCLPLLHNSQAGSILFTGSGAEAQSNAYRGAYAVSKSAIENLMTILADELEDTSQIRVNSIDPGATRTPMRARAFPAEDPITVKPAEDLVPLYLYFMDDISIGITGQQVSYSSQKSS